MLFLQFFHKELKTTGKAYKLGVIRLCASHSVFERDTFMCWLNGCYYGREDFLSLCKLWYGQCSASQGSVIKIISNSLRNHILVFHHNTVCTYVLIPVMDSEDTRNLMKSDDLLAADHLVTVVFLGQHTEGRLDDTTTQTQNQMEGWLCNTEQMLTS